MSESEYDDMVHSRIHVKGQERQWAEISVSFYILACTCLTQWGTLNIKTCVPVIFDNCMQ